MRKTNNKILILIFVVLLAIFFIYKMVRSPQLTKNLAHEQISIDTATITQLSLRLPSGEEIQLSRQDSWRIKGPKGEDRADTETVSNLLTAMAPLHLDRLVSKKEEKWEVYEVDEANGILVRAQAGEDEVVNWWVGKGDGSHTYIRIDDKVYSVKGNLKTKVNRSLSDWRDKRLFTSLNTEALKRISFQYPSDTGFVLEKSSSFWELGDEQVDSVKLSSFLSTLSSKKFYSFSDDFTASDEALYTLKFSGENSEASVKIWNPEEHRWVVQSSDRPETYFVGDQAVIGSLLIPKKNLVTAP